MPPPLDALPEGFEVEHVPAAASALPPGFEVEHQETGLPAGFAVEQPSAPPAATQQQPPLQPAGLGVEQPPEETVPGPAVRLGPQGPAGQFLDPRQSGLGAAASGFAGSALQAGTEAIAGVPRLGAGIIRGTEWVLERLGKGPVPTPGAEALESAAGSVEQAGQAAASRFQVAPQWQYNRAVRMAQIAGPAAGYGVAGILGGMAGGPIGAASALAVPAMTQGYESTFRQATEDGASPEIAHSAALASGLVNAGLMTMPTLGVLNRLAAPARQAALSELAGYLQTGGTMLGISQAQQLADNVIARHSYEPSRPLGFGLGQDLAEQFAAGAVLHGAGRTPAYLRGAPGVATSGPQPGSEEAPVATSGPQVAVPTEAPAPHGVPTVIDGTPTPPHIADLITAASERHGVPPEVLAWVARHESNYRPDAIGAATHAGRAEGIMQFMPGTAKEFGIDPFRPEEAIDGAARYLLRLHGRTGSWEGAVERYGTFSTGQGPEADARVRENFRRFMAGQPAQELRQTPTELRQTPTISDNEPVPREAAREQPAPVPLRSAGAEDVLGRIARGEPEESRVYTPSGRQVDVQHEIAELRDLIASHDEDFRPNPNYPQELQPRERSSAASQAQVRSIAANLVPERLGPSSDAAMGAPVVGPNGTVESGNGRVLALQQVYTDPLLAGQRTAYLNYLARSGADLSRFRQPVLIARRQTEMGPEELRQFAVEANERPVLAMNAAERARADADRAGAAIDLWRGEDTASAANRDFVRHFMASLPPEERGDMMAPDGALSAEGARRIQAAVTAHAYGQDLGPALERFLAGDSEGMRAVAGALSDVAGDWAQLRAAAQRGAIPPELDITPALGEAVQTLARARQLRRPVSELVAQTDVERPPLSPEGASLLSTFFRGPNLRQAAGRQAVADRLRAYAEDAQRVQQGPNLFGEAPPQPIDVLRAAVRRAEGMPAPEQANLPTASGFARVPKPPRNVAGQVDLLTGETAQPTPERQPEYLIGTDPRQIGLPGMEPSAVQAQAARDQAGRGALMPKGEQKPANEGLFEQPVRQPGMGFATAAPAARTVRPSVPGPLYTPQQRVPIRPMGPVARAAQATVGASPGGTARFADSVRRAWAPTSRGAGAGQIAGIVTKHNAAQALDAERTLHRLDDAMYELDKLPDAERLDVWQRAETGQSQANPELQAAANGMRAALDEWTTKIQGLGVGALKPETLVDNYMGRAYRNYREWSAALNDDAARLTAVRAGLGLPGSTQGAAHFLKERVFDGTLADAMRWSEIPDPARPGQNIRLEPLTTNPIRMQAWKLLEMQKFYHGTRMLNEIKQSGLTHWVPKSEEGAAVRGGEVQLDDRGFRTFAPPDSIEHFRVFDPGIRSGLGQIAAKLGVQVKTQLRPIGNVRGLGQAPPGAAGYSRRGQVGERFGSNETVLMHEIGHQLDANFGLSSSTYGFPRDPVAWQELAQLGRLRLPDPTRASAHDITYVESPGERIANLLHAWWHAPQLVEQVAPQAAALWRDMLARNKPLADLVGLVKPSVRMESETIEQHLPGLRQTGAWFAPEPVATVFNNFASQGWSRSSAYRAVRAVENGMNGLQLGLSGFHATFEALDAIKSDVALALQQAVRGELGTAAKTALMAPAAPVTAYRAGKQLQQWARELPANAPPEAKQLVRALELAGGRLGMDRYRVTETGPLLRNFKDIGRLLTEPSGFVGQIRDLYKQAPILQASAQAAGRVMDTVMQPIMGALVPRLKLGVFSHMAQDWMRRNSVASDSEASAAMRKIWDSVDNRMGEVVYDNIFWKNWKKDAAFLTFRSAGWNLGTLREIGGGVVDAATAVKNLTTGQKAEFTHRTAYTLAMLMVDAAIGGLLTYLYTGRGPQERKDLFYPPTGRHLPSGAEERISIPSYWKDIQSFSTHPLQTVVNKLNPLLTSSWELATNRDYYGHIIYYDKKDNPVTAYASYLLGETLPFSIRNMMRTQESGGTMTDAALGFFGIQPAPGYITQPERQQAWQAKQDLRSYKARQRFENRQHSPAAQ